MRCRVRGGTLTLLYSGIFDSLDTSQQLIGPGQLLGLTNDALVTFKRVGGADGLQLVPDLADSLPAATDRGTTYTFRLRPGIRDSTGRPVTAEDVRWTIERLFKLDSPAKGFYTGILGTLGCVRQPSTCDLKRGIVTNNRTRTITFHLREPDGAFLSKLTLQHAFLVPAGTPARIFDRRPLPATGPYRIVSYQPRRELTLARNPVFHEWSRAAQPDGYPNRIVWKFDLSPKAEVALIEHEKADWMFDTVPADKRNELATQYASQVHVDPALWTEGHFLNTQLPPFDDVRVRRAVNYAVDRRAIVRLYGGSTVAEPTCQILPPRFPGYRRYCPYAHRPDSAQTWPAPDLARARKLVAASHTKGTRVTVLSLPNSWSPFATTARYLASILSNLGYRASVRIEPWPSYIRLVHSGQTQAGIISWAADYPAASDFIDLKLGCTSGLNNEAEFCDPSIQPLIKRAGRLEGSDLHAADRLWARIDHKIVDQAPWVPEVTRTWLNFVSNRVGNYQFHPVWGLLVGQLWVR